MLRKAFLISISILIPLAADARVYKCVLDGKTTFSQRPCEGDISEVTVKEASPRSSSAESNSPDYKQRNKELDAAINKRRADNKLRGLKRDLKNLKKKKARDISYWRSQISRAQTKADVLIIQQHIADLRSEYDEKIRDKENDIRTAKSSIGPSGN